jgi:3-hydroxyanthranilate 3,4-dioxygenase
MMKGVAMAATTRTISPLNLLRWIEENRDAFRPPVANKVIWQDSEFICMVIHGPNSRNDFHVDPGDEIFYQLRGDIRVDIMQDGERQTNLVREGDLLLVPACVPHAPLRPSDTWGLVVERKRRSDELDQLVWFCESCNHELHRTTFNLTNIETELGAAIAHVNADEQLRTCQRCGTVLPIPGEFRF